MSSLKEKMYRFMQGRYGMDDLGRFSMIVILVLMVLSMIFQSGLMNL